MIREGEIPDFSREVGDLNRCISQNNHEPESTRVGTFAVSNLPANKGSGCIPILLRSACFLCIKTATDALSHTNVEEKIRSLGYALRE